LGWISSLSISGDEEPGTFGQVGYEKACAFEDLRNQTEGTSTRDPNANSQLLANERLISENSVSIDATIQQAG